MKEKIGTNAGRIWSYLSEAGEKDLKDVKKDCKLSDKELYAALGWLAREEKVFLKENGKDVAIGLI